MTETLVAEDLIGTVVLDRTDDRIGEIRQVYRDLQTERPTWVSVDLLEAQVLVPLEGADWTDSSLRTSVFRSSAQSAPQVDLEEPLSFQEQERLLRHYGIPCVCTPREDLDLTELMGEDDLSYSVKD